LYGDIIKEMKTSHQGGRKMKIGGGRLKGEKKSAAAYKNLSFTNFHCCPTTANTKTIALQTPADS
jgi:hypothetical protein